MSKDLEVKKVVGFWRVYIKGAWRGHFASEEEARRVADRMYWNKINLGYPISWYHFDVVCCSLGFS